MNDKLRERLSALRSEYEAGQKMLADIDAKRANLTQTLLRIEGAMHVLEEMLEKDGPAPGTGGSGGGAPPAA